MTVHRFIFSLLVPLAFSLAPAGQAEAKGACVSVKNEALQCLDHVTSQRACSSKASKGEFHDGTTCKNIGYGSRWGLVKAPAPPAKPSFEGVSYQGKAMPAIPSPMKESKRKMRF